MENLSLSVPDLLQTVKRYVDEAKHEELDAMLRRYMAKELGKTQVDIRAAPAPTPRPDLAPLNSRAPRACVPAAPRAASARRWA